MDHHLTTLSTRLAAFLAEVLPRLSDHWWQTYVLEELTFQQHSYVDTAGYTRLDQLDLAALLRIADRNWSEIAHAASLPPTARNWLKEAQTIRNRWAHAPVSGIPDDERYRDLDTIERRKKGSAAEKGVRALFLGGFPRRIRRGLIEALQREGGSSCIRSAANGMALIIIPNPSADRAVIEWRRPTPQGPPCGPGVAGRNNDQGRPAVRMTAVNPVESGLRPRGCDQA